ncbi:MAG: hypothetical protein IJU19_03680, partial [Bacteroidales bacterium]|nr:hypothetical protein [Bacteroidales bacterium]
FNSQFSIFNLAPAPYPLRIHSVSTPYPLRIKSVFGRFSYGVDLAEKRLGWLGEKLVLGAGMFFCGEVILSRSSGIRKAVEKK